MLWLTINEPGRIRKRESILWLTINEPGRVRKRERCYGKPGRVLWLTINEPGRVFTVHSKNIVANTHIVVCKTVKGNEMGISINCTGLKMCFL